MSQQTPSTHSPLPHWLFEVQVPAWGFLGTHWKRALQKSPETQSPSPPQVTLQAVAPQTYSPQDWVVVAAQVPLPAQEAARVSTPPVQDGWAHCVSAPGKVQAFGFRRLQEPPQVVPSPAQSARAPWGWPVSTGEQTPLRPGTSHAWH